VGPGSFWAGKFSHSETYPAHNERGDSPSPSMTSPTQSPQSRHRRAARHSVGFATHAHL
jgi:hypothetical protein